MTDYRSAICEKEGECQRFCGMCHIPMTHPPEEKYERFINKDSLFGVCRRVYGECSCGLCKKIVNTHYMKLNFKEEE